MTTEAGGAGAFHQYRRMLFHHLGEIECAGIQADHPSSVVANEPLPTGPFHRDGSD